MPTMQQLLFAQHFPFSNSARKIVEEEGVSLHELQAGVIERAAIMLQHAVAGKKYGLQLRNSELLLQEISAFPVAKILVSFVKDQRLYEKFAGLFADAALNYLNSAENAKEEAISLASELQIRFDFAPEADFLVSVPLHEFLQVRFSDEQLKLVNQHVSYGRVFLDLNGFCRLLRAIVFKQLLSSLPVQTNGLPEPLSRLGAQFRGDFQARQQRQFSVSFRGSASPSAFPPCMASLYGQLLEGRKLPHMARFYLASFLNRIGMTKEQLLELFKKSPDFNEKIATYQINRIVKQNYTPPSCTKVRAQGYCQDADCNVRHPLSYYRRALRKEKPGSAKE